MIRPLALLAATLLAAPAGAEPVVMGDLSFERPALRETPKGAPVAGGYLLVENRGAEDDRLLSAATDRAERVEIHEMIHEGDVMRMRALPDGLAIPAGARVALRPGGLHLMLVRPEPLTLGEAPEVTLRFERAGEVTLPFPVQALPTILEGAMEADEMEMAPHGDGHAHDGAGG